MIDPITEAIAKMVRLKSELKDADEGYQKILRRLAVSIGADFTESLNDLNEGTHEPKTS